MLIETLRIRGLLSFAPDAPEIPLQGLNVVIGPNGSGKSNLVEAIALLRATPTGLAAAIREGGGAREWLWKGTSASSVPASLDARLARSGQASLRYRLDLATVGTRAEVVDEAIEAADPPTATQTETAFYYRYQGGNPTLHVREPAGGRTLRQLGRETLSPHESILQQRRDPELYPELTWCADQFGRIQTFRDWSFGKDSALRQPQPADLPTDALLPDARNLGLILNQLEHSDAGAVLADSMGRFLPRFQRFSTLVQAGSVQIYLHEQGLSTPIPATRLSDGTLRFLALNALLLMPDPPPLICIEEPELGLHPDAVALLADLLVSASARTQLIVTTHSDALVSALTNHISSVLVCEYLQGTTFTRLDAGRLQHLLDRYRLGDLWRMGELGGNP